MKKPIGKYNWKKALITVCIVGVLILGVGLPIFAPLGIEAFLSWASVIIVLYAIWISVQSLILSRATTRPFLNLQLNLIKGSSLDRAILVAEMENTGNLPADQVTVNCSWYIQTSDHAEQCSLELEKANQSIIFPAERAKSTYLVKSSEDVNKLTHQGSRVKVTANYNNKLSKQGHTTQRTFRIVFASAAPSFNVAQTITVPEEDYWD